IEGFWTSDAATVFSAIAHSLLASQCVWVLSAYLDGNLFGFGFFGLGECHMEQSMLILSLDFVLVDFNGQLNMPYELARRPFTTMEGFRLHVSGYPPFLSCNAQGVAMDAEIQGALIDTWSEGFYVYRLFIFIEVDQRVTPSCPARQKRGTGKRLTTRTVFAVDAVNFPTQCFQCLPGIPVCHDAISFM